MKIPTINTSKITWFVMHGDAHDDFLTAYCADGDGILQLIDYGTHVELSDQGEVVKTWDAANSVAELLPMLENAQQYLAATYHEIFENARHWEDDTADFSRQ